MTKTVISAQFRSFKLFVYYLRFLALIIGPSASFSQIPEARFRRISNEQGLSNSTINCIFQDSRGFMWFGTRDGLNRFDGSNVLIYKNDANDTSTISNNFIKCIAEDASHKLWIGTSSGLNRFDPVTNTFTRFTHNTANGQSISNNTIAALYSLPTGSMLAGTAGGGLELINAKTGTIMHLAHNARQPGSNNINCIYRDSYKNIWLGTPAGLYSFDADSKTFKLHGSITNNITAIAEDRENNLWLGTADDGLLVYNDAGDTFKSIKHNGDDHNSLAGNLILSLTTDKKGNVWIGTVNQGFSLYNPDKKTFFNYYPKPENNNSLSNNTVSAIFEDKQGDIWIGTHRGGINLYTYEVDKFKLYRQTADANSLSYNDVKAFCQDSKGNIWVGTDGGGLNLFNRKEGTFTHFKNNPDDPGSQTRN